MSYPKLTINKEKLKHNVVTLKEKCQEKGVEMACVTKVFCAEKSVSQAIVECGVQTLADSRVENLKKMEGLGVDRLLLRLPMQSETDCVVKYAEISLNSEIATIKKLDASAKLQNKIHKIILMRDLGDLREGLFREEDFLSTVKEVLELKNIELYGIGVNLTCYGGVIPEETNLEQLVMLKEKLEEEFHIKIPVVSGGNSSSFYLLPQNRLPKGINHLRLGEIVVLGRETAYGDIVEGLHEDVFTLEAEIIELQEKPSIPIGTIGMDAFGNKPTFVDKGMRKRAIVAVGRQDAFASEITPKDLRISVLGQSSDHTILDVTEAGDSFRVGDIISFQVSYGSILTLSTSQYVKKEMI